MFNSVEGAIKKSLFVLESGISPNSGTNSVITCLKTGKANQEGSQSLSFLELRTQSIMILSLAKRSVDEVKWAAIYTRLCVNPFYSKRDCAIGGKTEKYFQDNFEKRDCLIEPETEKYFQEKSSPILAKRRLKNKPDFEKYIYILSDELKIKNIEIICNVQREKGENGRPALREIAGAYGVSLSAAYKQAKEAKELIDEAACLGIMTIEDAFKENGIMS